MAGFGEPADSAAPAEPAAAPTPPAGPDPSKWYADADPADAAADKVGTAPEPPPGAPQRYELAIEGLDVDPALVSAAEPVLRELNLSNEHANKLLPVAQQLVSKTTDNIYREMNEAVTMQRKAWKDAFTADPEIGGARARESARLAGSGLDALGFKAGHPFRQFLDETGVGNHPDMIRAFRKVGEMVARGGYGRGPSSRDIPLEVAMYGKGRA